MTLNSLATLTDIGCKSFSQKFIVCRCETKVDDSKTRQDPIIDTLEPEVVITPVSFSLHYVTRFYAFFFKFKFVFFKFSFFAVTFSFFRSLLFLFLFNPQLFSLPFFFFLSLPSLSISKFSPPVSPPAVPPLARIQPRVPKTITCLRK